jgi:hypothetical protein
MRRLVIAGMLVVLSVSGCASMKGTSTSDGPPAASQSIPPPAAAPPSKAESSTNDGSDPSSTPAPPPVSPATRSSPAKAKSSPEPRLVKEPGATATQTRPSVLPPPSPPSPTASPIASPTLNLADLEQRLRDTRAIGVFTKLSLKNQVDDLLNAFRALYRGPDKHPPVELRQRYDLLLLKVLTLLQDGDPPLAAAISSSREAIWSILADPDKFAKI